MRPEDDKSTIIRFEELDECESSMRAEQTIKRKWFSSMKEMKDMVMSDIEDHELYCHAGRIERVGVTIYKTIQIAHNKSNIII